MSAAPISPASSAVLPPSTFDVTGGSWSIIVWGSLIVSLIAVGVSSVRSILKSQRLQHLSLSAIIRCIFLSIILLSCVYATWTPMLRMVHQDMLASGYPADAINPPSVGTVMEWLTSSKQHRSSSLFFVAYKTVCESAEVWYITSQLLMFVLTYSVWLWIETPRLSFGIVSRWWSLAILWIGFAGAICASFTAFQLLRTVIQDENERVELAIQSGAKSSSKLRRYPYPLSSQSVSRPSKILLLCLLFAILTVPILQFSVSSASSIVPRVFKLALILGHAALLVPFAHSYDSTSVDPADANAISSTHTSVMSLYAGLAGLSFFSHLLSVPTLLSTHISTMPAGITEGCALLWNMWPSLLYRTLYSSHAQQSISMDVVFVYVLLAFFIYREVTRPFLSMHYGWFIAALIGIGTGGLLMPISVLFPLFLFAREYRRVYFPGVVIPRDAAPAAQPLAAPRHIAAVDGSDAPAAPSRSTRRSSSSKKKSTSSKKKSR